MAPVKDVHIPREKVDRVKMYINERMDIDESTGCWIWNNKLNKSDYGVGKLDNKSILAHRLCYAAYNSGILKGLDDNGVRTVIRHLCNHPPCVNPEHLACGTDRENADDRRVAGTHPKGEKCHLAKLTVEHVHEIIAKKGESVSERAMLYGVSEQAIKDIDMNRTWCHIPRPDGTLPRKRMRQMRALEWTIPQISEAFNVVKEHCEYDTEPNQFTGTPCFVWKWGYERQGRGIINYDGGQVDGYFVACMFNEQRQRPEGMVTRHLCGNGSCCEPTHLKFGTRKENALDTIQMKQHTGVKLDENKVREIRRLRDNGMKLEEIASRFNVNWSYVSLVVKKKRWAHVQ